MWLESIVLAPNTSLCGTPGVVVDLRSVSYSASQPWWEMSETHTCNRAVLLLGCVVLLAPGDTAMIKGTSAVCVLMWVRSSACGLIVGSHSAFRQISRIPQHADNHTYRMHMMSRLTCIRFHVHVRHQGVQRRIQQVREHVYAGLSLAAWC